MKSNILHTIALPATKGTSTIAQATDVFTSYIDSNFKTWGIDKKGRPTKKVNLQVREMTEDGTFAQIFTDPENMCISQEQIIEFCKNHKEKLSQEWYTFFLFKVDEKFFVARVLVDDRYGLYASVHEFSYGLVWHAGSVVVS